jgi:hypothetical protein
VYGPVFLVVVHNGPDIVLDVVIVVIVEILEGPRFEDQMQGEN